MARPRGGGTLRTHFGELGNEGVADDHNPDQQSSGDCDDGSA